MRGDMKKVLMCVGILLFAIFAFSDHQVYAGGCCYKYFNSTDGIAGTKDAQISVAFVDPFNTYVDPGKTTLRSISDQKIDIHITSAKPGQMCLVNTEKTDNEGHIDAHCSSPYAGGMLVYFTAPDMSVQANDMIKSVPKSVNFSSDPNAPAVSSTPTPVRETTASTPTVTQQEEQNNCVPETAELQKRLDELEEKVASQANQITVLQRIINSFLGFFNRLFGGR